MPIQFSSLIFCLALLCTSVHAETPPRPIALKGHSHTALVVSDLDLSLDWYQRVLGLEVLFITDLEGAGISEAFGEPGTRLRLAKGKLAGTILEFVEIQHRKPIERPAEPGILGVMESITFYVDDLETARQTASAHGVEVPPALTEILGNHVFMIQDPDGTKIEFNKRP